MTEAYVTWLAFVALQMVVGYALVGWRVPPAVTWVCPPLSVAAAHFLLLGAPPVVRMLGLIIPLLHAMKIVVASRHPGGRLAFGNWVLYYLATVNMNPGIFRRRVARTVDWPMLRGALLHLALGGGLLVGLSFFVAEAVPGASSVVRWGWSLLALLGLSLVLHFGLLPLTTVALKAVGIPDYPMFRQPYRARSLSEFWGRRWNVAFSEMTATAVFKPLIRRVGVAWAGFLSFMVSGLLHEVAISLSVVEGFGLPMLYFLIHGGLMALERRLFGQRDPGAWWVALALVLPLPLLFHEAFLLGVVWPLITDPVGSLWAAW